MITRQRDHLCEGEKALSSVDLESNTVHQASSIANTPTSHNGEEVHHDPAGTLDDKEVKARLGDTKWSTLFTLQVLTWTVVFTTYIDSNSRGNHSANDEKLLRRKVRKYHAAERGGHVARNFHLRANALLHTLPTPYTTYAHRILEEHHDYSS